MSTEKDWRRLLRFWACRATEVASIVGFYSLYYDEPAGRYRIQVCTDLPCALRGADKFLQELCARLGIKPGETTADGLITVEAVMCLAACDKAPMFQVQSGAGLAYHENQTVESALALIEQLRADAAPAQEGWPWLRRIRSNVLCCVTVTSPTWTSWKSIARMAVLKPLRRSSSYAAGEVTDVVKASGLRGRGGAGFPTGVKWSVHR